MLNLIEISTSLIFVAWAVCSLQLVVMFSKCANLHIQDKTDARTPSLFGFSIISFISILWFLISIFKGRVHTQVSLLPRFIFFVFLTQNLKSRMLGFPSIKLGKKAKMFIYMLTDALLFIVVCIVIYSVDFEPIYDDKFTLSVLLKTSHYLLDMSSSTSGFFITNLFIFVSYFIALAITAFDAMENRSKRTLIYDVVAFLLPISLCVVYNCMTSIVARVVVSNLTISIAIICMYAYMNKDYKSILKRANGIEMTVRIINEAIIYLSRNGYTDDTDTVKVVLDILSENKTTRDVVLNKRYLRRKYNDTVNYFKKRLHEDYGVVVS